MTSLLPGVSAKGDRAMLALKSLVDRYCLPGGTHRGARGIGSRRSLLTPFNVQEEVGETYTGKSKIVRVDTVETLAGLVISLSPRNNRTSDVYRASAVGWREANGNTDSSKMTSQAI
jgi:hypothetical protein